MKTYFRHRKLFQRKPHPYDIGIFLGVKPGYEDNHFLKKIYTLSHAEHERFYQHHLRHFLDRNQGEKNDFFRHVWALVENRIWHYERQDPFSPKHGLYLSNINHLKAFQSFLASIDEWNQTKALEDLLAEKDKEVQRLKQEVAQLTLRLSEAMKFEPSEKILIRGGKLHTVIDLFRQLQELTSQDGTSVFLYQDQSSWYKILARYFNNDGKVIPIETIRNYFPLQKNTRLIKGSSIAEDKKHFLIVPSRPV